MKYRRYLRLRGRTAGERARELEEEIEAHIAMRAEELEQHGVPHGRAVAEARARFGDRGALMSSVRTRDERLRRAEIVDDLVRDARVAWRRAVASPHATLLTVLTFAVGIGLTTATLAFADHIVVRPLPYPAPERLVQLQGMDSLRNPVVQVSSANWLDWTAGSRTLAATALYLRRELSVATAGRAYHVPGQLVTPQFFDALGVSMLAGRGFAPGDADAGAIVVSESFWRRELGGSHALGQGLRVDGSLHEVVGVVATRHVFPAGTDIWKPLEPRPEAGSRRNHINWHALARLRDGVTARDAADELSTAAHAVQTADPASDYSYGVRVVPLRTAVVGDYATLLALVTGAVTFVLLLACANLAALNHARTTVRRDEVGIRLALGASRGRVIRQLMTEQLALALAGAVLGVLFASWATRLVSVRLAEQLPRAAEVVLDVRVLAIAVLLTVGSAVAAGLAPALLASRASPRGLLGTRSGRAGARGMSGAVLVGCEVALAIVLLTGGTLLVRSFSALLGRDLGFEPAGVAAGSVALTDPMYRDSAAARLAFWDDLLRRVRAEPGVASAALANWVPGGDGGTAYLVVEGVGEVPDGARYRAVSEGYFETLGIPLLRGRAFDRRDGPGSARVAVINRRLAERHFPDVDPIGRRIKLPGMEGPAESAPWVTVIGVTGDIRQYGYEDDLKPEAFVSVRQVPVWTHALSVVARHRDGHALQAANAVQGAVRALDPALAVRVTLLEAQLGELLATRRITMAVLSGFALLALALAVLGVYGLMAFAVARRVPELAIRAALGASQGGIVRMVLTNAATILMSGATVGLLMAYWLAKLLQGFLIDVTSADALSYVAATLTLLLAGALAAFVPAARAGRVDPMTVLRGEA